MDVDAWFWILLFGLFCGSDLLRLFACWFGVCVGCAACFERLAYDLDCVLLFACMCLVILGILLDC